MPLTKNLGIIGGGQLGMMLVEAAKSMPEHISDIIVLDPTKNCPASRVGAKQIVADFKDKNAIVEWWRQAEISSYEIESCDGRLLESLHNEVPVKESSRASRTIEERGLR